jgi:hypothetical protein
VYETPPGCEVTTQPNATGIICGGEPVVLWAQPPNDLAALEGASIESMRGNGLREGPPVACRIEGIAAKCRLFRPTPATDPRAVYLGRATVRGQPIAVLCLANDASRLPPACATVLSVGAAKP